MLRVEADVTVSGHHGQDLLRFVPFGGEQAAVIYVMFVESKLAVHERAILQAVQESDRDKG